MAVPAELNLADSAGFTTIVESTAYKRNMPIRDTQGQAPHGSTNFVELFQPARENQQIWSESLDFQ